MTVNQGIDKVNNYFIILQGGPPCLIHTYYDGRGCVVLEAGYSQMHSTKLRKTH